MDKNREIDNIIIEDSREDLVNFETPIGSILLTDRSRVPIKSSGKRR